MSSQARAIMQEAMIKAQVNKFSHVIQGRPNRPAKPSELLALQRRINKKYGHPYLMKEGV